MAQGKTNHEIGVILGMCTATVRKHMEHILVRRKVENRTAAASVAFTTLNQMVGSL